MTGAARLEGLGTTIFTEMTALAVRTGAINLGQGFPDTDGPPAVIEAAVAALRSGHNQYAPLPGVPALREAVLEHQRSYYGLEPEDVLITFGATEAIAASLLGLCDPGDEVVVLEPPVGRDVEDARMVLADHELELPAALLARDADLCRDTAAYCARRAAHGALLAACG